MKKPHFLGGRGAKQEETRARTGRLSCRDQRRLVKNKRDQLIELVMIVLESTNILIISIGNLKWWFCLLPEVNSVVTCKKLY